MRTVGLPPQKDTPPLAKATPFPEEVPNGQLGASGKSLEGELRIDQLDKIGGSIPLGDGSLKVEGKGGVTYHPGDGQPPIKISVNNGGITFSCGHPHITNVFQPNAKLYCREGTLMVGTQESNARPVTDLFPKEEAKSTGGAPASQTPASQTMEEQLERMERAAAASGTTAGFNSLLRSSEYMVAANNLNSKKAHYNSLSEAALGLAQSIDKNMEEMNKIAKGGKLNEEETQRLRELQQKTAYLKKALEIIYETQRKIAS
jgi:hypothetical protein